MGSGWIIFANQIEKNKEKIAKGESNYSVIEEYYGISKMTKKFKKSTIIYSNSNLTGEKYRYKKNTAIEILENTSFNISKIRVLVTGRIGYVYNSNY